jgi:hypothetical protein
MGEGPAAYVSFDELVDAYPGRTGGDGAAAEELYYGDGDFEARRKAEEAAARERFDDLVITFQERERGRIDASYYGRATRNGAALLLSADPPRTYRLYTKLDLVGAKEAAKLVSRCEHVRVAAEELLAGEERQRVIRLVYERLVQLIRMLDDAATAMPPRREMAYAEAPPASPEEAAERERSRQRERQLEEQREREAAQALEEAKKNALAVIEADIEQTEAICRRAVRRRAMMAYFYGMLGGVAVFTSLGIGVGLLLGNVDIPGFDLSEFITTFVAGAIGAIVSVMSRMSSGNLDIDFETRRGFLALLGGFRPLIGAIFGVALYFGMASGILPIEPPSEETQTFFFLTFLAFLAGFSERWAQDMLVSSPRNLATPTPVRERTL